MRLDLIVQSLVNQFSEDPSAPSVVISWLADKNAFYGSLVRYSKPFGEGKTVLYKTTAASLEELYIKFAEQLGLQ